MNSNEPIIRVENLSKQFLEVQALKDVSPQIHPGRIVGLVGANCGGKSTLLRTMVGLYVPDQGSCTTFGRSAVELRPEVDLPTDGLGPDPFLSCNALLPL